MKAAAYKADVGNQGEIENAVQKITTDFGKLDIIVVNSGIASSVAAEDYTAEQWRDIMKVNLDGAFYSAQAASQIFKKQGHGNVIFTASVSATLVNVPQKQAAVCCTNRKPNCTMTITNVHSTMLRKLAWFNCLSVCLLNGLISAASTVSPPVLSPRIFSIFTQRSGGRSGTAWFQQTGSRKHMN